jgi:hypothetical protein
MSRNEIEPHTQCSKTPAKKTKANQYDGSLAFPWRASIFFVRSHSVFLQLFLCTFSALPANDFPRFKIGDQTSFLDYPENKAQSHVCSLLLPESPLAGSNERHRYKRPLLHSSPG